MDLDTIWEEDPNEAKNMLKELRRALLDAFSSSQALTKYLNRGFPQDVQAIDTSGSPDDIVSELLIWARASGKLTDVAVEACDQNSDNPRLKQFKDKYLSTTRGRIPIYFVVASMTSEEVGKLDDGTIFQSAKEALAFQTFRETLQKNGVADWKSTYSVEREDWRPPSEDRKVCEVIQDTFTRFNRTNLELTDATPLDPQFVSADFFGLDEQKFYDTCTLIEQSGAIIIVDAISFFHPTIQERLTQSALIPRDNVSLLIFSPINPLVIHINQLIEDVVRDALGRALNRFNTYFDWRYEVGVGNILAMQRWLYSLAVPGIAANAQKLKPLDKNRLLAKQAIDRSGR
jgi:hypothetical protein